MSVKVAVRVRPFIQREKDRNAVCCVEMVFRILTLSQAKPLLYETRKARRRPSRSTILSGLMIHSESKTMGTTTLSIVNTQTRSMSSIP